MTVCRWLDSSCSASQCSRPFSQALCFAVALLCAREFAREIRDTVEYYARLSEPQEQSEQSSRCVVLEVQGWGRPGFFRLLEVLPSGKLSVC